MVSNSDNFDQGTSSVINKKRGRPKKSLYAPSMEVIDETPRKNVSWTLEMEEELLELRLVVYKENFLDAKDKISLGRAWSKILLDFNLKFQVEFSLEQLKNKYNSLKSTFRNVSSSSLETGNNPAPKIPENWEVLNQFFQGRSGLSGIPFGESVQNILENEESDVSELESARKKSRSNPVNPSTSRNSSRNNLGDSLVEMGALLNDGLMALANSQGPREDPALNHTLEKIQKSLDENSMVNLEILRLLKSLKDK